MAKPIKKSQPIKTPENKQANPAKRRLENKTSSVSMFSILENFLNKHHVVIISSILLIAALFSFLSFDNKISLANDDALYIEAGYNYAKDFFGYYYLETAPLYPIILSLFIKIFGIKLMWLKCTSILFFVLALYFIYKAFKERISYLILFPSLLLTAINFQFLVYASLTYTETFSLMVFSLALMLFFKYMDRMEKEDYTLKPNIPFLILFGFICLLLMISRNVALAMVGVVAVFFIYRKKYIEPIIFTSSFIVFFYLYKLMLKVVWHLDASQFTSQGNKMLNKDAYNPQAGKETMAGLLVRFWENCQIYISSRLYYTLGFRPEEMSPNNIALTLFSIAIITWSLWLMHKKKHYVLLFTTVFYVVLLAATFISLHTTWGQTRLIMLYLPFILFSVFYLFYYYGEQFSIIQVALPFVFFILLLTSLSATTKQIGERFPIFKENISGDATYGFTPDWQNYIKMSKWCAQQFPNETKSIAVRKAPMSFIFSDGKEFYPIYGTPTTDADSLLMPLRKENVNYMVLAELRAMPSMYVEGQIIGTMHRYAYYIQQKYPGAFSLVHQEGDLEKSQLYKINYAYIDSLKATFVSK
jgi:hypothetical protein